MSSSEEASSVPRDVELFSMGAGVIRRIGAFEVLGRLRTASEASVFFFGAQGPDGERVVLQATLLPSGEPTPEFTPPARVITEAIAVLDGGEQVRFWVLEPLWVNEKGLLSPESWHRTATLLMAALLEARKAESPAGFFWGLHPAGHRPIAWFAVPWLRSEPDSARTDLRRLSELLVHLAAPEVVAKPGLKGWLTRLTSGGFASPKEASEALSRLRVEPMSQEDWAAVDQLALSWSQPSIPTTETPWSEVASTVRSEPEPISGIRTMRFGRTQEIEPLSPDRATQRSATRRIAAGALALLIFFGLLAFFLRVGSALSGFHPQWEAAGGRIEEKE